MSKNYILVRECSDETGFTSTHVIRTSLKDTLEGAFEKLESFIKICLEKYPGATVIRDGDRSAMVQFTKDALYGNQVIKVHGRIIYKIEELI